jgi:predicted O-methyltransferase YrrM
MARLAIDRAVAAAPTRRDIASRARDMSTEVRLAPGFRGVAAAMGSAAAARGAGCSWRKAAGLGIASGVLQGALLRTEYRVSREIRNSGDAAALAAWLGEATPPLGAWAIEPDFGRLIAMELADAPDTVVECGSGVTTLLIAAFLHRNERGRLFSLEADRAFAERARAQLRAAGLADVCEIIWAPLVEQSVGGHTVCWYDPAQLGQLPARIDLLVVDGPPAVRRWARWPAVETFIDRLAPGAAVLVDDGRRRDERRTVFRWRAEHNDLELHWHDTIKGTWRLVKADAPGAPSPVVSAYQRARRGLNPRPGGYGRWPVQR